MNITKSYLDSVQDSCCSKKIIEIDNTEIIIYNTKEKEYRELHGLTLSINKTTKLYRIYLTMPNIEELTNPSNFKDIPLRKVYEAMNGSTIQFINISGNYTAKSRTSFTSKQAKIAQEIYDNCTDLQFFVNSCTDNELTPIFELVGLENQKVVPYQFDKRLYLVAVRDQEGHYLDLDMFDYQYKPQTYNYSLEEIFEKAKDVQNFKGYILQFKKDKIFKVETDWYKSTLNDIKRLEDKSELLKYLLLLDNEDPGDFYELNDILQIYLEHHTIRLHDICDIVKSKDNLASYTSDEMFHIIVKISKPAKLCSKEEIKELIKIHLIHKYNTHEKADKFLSSI